MPIDGEDDVEARQLDGRWRAVELTVSGTDLELYVRETNGNYWQLDERSDGLRWFVALVAYLHSESVEAPPILLVDEAEQHLHYDVQADLVRAFERQEAVADVIYTTHSPFPLAAPPARRAHRRMA